MRCHTGPDALKKNHAKAFSLLSEAVKQKAKLVVLPEAFNYGYELKQEALDLIPKDSESLPLLQSFAQDYGIYLFAGVLEREGDLIYNRLYAINPKGLILGYYTKIHLFCSAPTWENKSFTAGDTPAIVQTEYGPMGLMICYDLRFPELARNYALKGCEIIVMASAWGKARQEHFKTLTRARTIENQIFMISSDQVGEAESKLQFAGASGIFDPLGQALIQNDDGEDVVLVAEINQSVLLKTREFMDCFSHRVTKAYNTERF